ncbi:hypothetical protein CVT26_010390 [Gymnopilus dilepis]|uniref:Checkpoint protein RAD24-like helical bundle domain-containing protein n=1 Tax=Gymnopilus dilepis TaxID=231916 RepID=A0A409VZ44_9AGAR|nr:hypothetical protein CVT26_010390 [Gymnopilus dilepis]
MAPKPKPPSQTQGTSKSKSKSKASATTRPRTVRLDSEGPPASSSSKLTYNGTASQKPLNMARLDPLTAFRSQESSRGDNSDVRRFASPAASTSSVLSTQSQSRALNLDLKGKGKAKEVFNAPALTEDVDDTLWVDKYEPITEAELAVHVRKVDDVRRWLGEAFDGGPSGKLTKYRRILVLTGPAGTGKTATIRVLSKEMGFEILEWKNTIAEVSTMGAFGDRDDSSYASNGDDFGSQFDSDYEGLFTKFEAFLTRATTCQSIFNSISTTTASSSTSSQSRSRSRSTASQKPTAQASTQNPAPKPPLPQKRRLILLEDLPNILHAPTQAKFHEALTSLTAFPPATPPVPLVIVVSDAGVRGETGEGDDLASAMGGGTGGGRGWGREKVVDVRSVLPRELRGGPYVCEIGYLSLFYFREESFNPIAPTLMRKALQSLLTTHFSSTSSKTGAQPSKEILDIVIDSSNGDIRSAIMALQFACIAEAGGTSSTKQKNGRKKTAKGGSSKLQAGVVMEAVTRREQSLALFHLLGKVLYNKRKGDAPSSSTSAKDAQKEREADALLPDPSPLPEHLKSHERRTSRVDVDALYADSPIDSSLFGLYIHQNYTQFCTDVDHCESVADWLSWVDCSGGEKWYHTNPHQFHLLTLGTLHSLPSPVPRKGQKVFKPDFFANLGKEKEAWEGVREVRGWVLGEGRGLGGRANGSEENDAASRVGAYSNSELILELGGLLKAYDVSHSIPFKHKPPPIHRLFSRMEFMRSSSASMGSGKTLDEKGDGTDVVDDGAGLVEDEGRDLGVFSPGVAGKEEHLGGWLESDDIDEF